MRTDRRQFVAASFGSAAILALSRRAEATTPANKASLPNLAHDPLRPQYHFLPPRNWMNDPNGPIYWGGSYHMFYQYNPNGAFWGDMHWGHAVSPDMVHWRHLPVALAPTPGGPDADGCFTGTAVVQDGHVVLCYTGIKAAPEPEATIRDHTPMYRETQCLAIAADPDLETWNKIEKPVISSPPAGMQVNGFRDPSPWLDGDWWYTVIATGIANQGGAVFLYRSRDLRNWEYMHILSGSEHRGSDRFTPLNPWEVWECPEFFSLGEWHILIFSVAGRVYWQSGKLDKQKMIFQPEQAGIADYGVFYAAKTQLSQSGERILWGWINESRPLAEYKAAGWAGLMSLPRVLSTSSDGRLRFRIAPEIDKLRSRKLSAGLSTSDADGGQPKYTVVVLGSCCEILCRVRRGSVPFTLTLGSENSAGSPWLTIRFDPDRRSQAIIDGRPIPLDLGEDEDLEIHLYVDGSVVESFLNDQAAHVKRFYYDGAQAQNLAIHWEGSKAAIIEWAVWELMPISNDRLTT